MNLKSMHDDELILSYLDEELDEEQLQEFRKRLESSAFQLRLAQFSVDTAALYELGLQNNLRTLESQTRLRTVGPRTWIVPALSTAAVLILMVSAWLSAVMILRPAPLITMTKVPGTVFAEKMSDQVQKGDQFPSETTLSCIEPGTEFAFFNGTTALLGPKTQVRISGQENGMYVFLKQGKITLNVTKGNPLTVSTSLSTIAVTGTEFSVERRGAYDAVKVREGSVDVIRIADGSRTVLEKGTRVAVIPEGEALKSGPLFRTYQLWELDIDSLAPDKTRGEFVSSGLPAGSSKGLKTVKSLDRNIEIPDFSMSTSSWKEPYFPYTENASLYIRYKAERFAYFHLMLSFRTAKLPGDFACNLFYQEFWKSTKPGKWVTAEIPLSSFNSRHVDENVQGLQGLMAYGFVLESQGKDPGVTIDRMWVTYTEELDFE